jgi:hypothetical protein
LLVSFILSHVFIMVVIIFLFPDLRFLLSLSSWIVLVMMDSPSCCLSWIVFTMPSFLEDSFAGYNILGWKLVFSFRTLNMLYLSWPVKLLLRSLLLVWEVP